MAKQVATSVVVKIGGVDLSEYVASVNFTTNVNEVTTTNFASGGNVERVGGLKDSSLQISFMQDFAAAAVEATVYPLIGSTAAFVVMRRWIPASPRTLEGAPGGVPGSVGRGRSG